MVSLCVFCGSSTGSRPEYVDAAERLAHLAADRGVRLVFGGGQIGLMGVLADSALAAGGEVVGVIPRALRDRELAHERVHALHVVDSLHERKALMADMSDAFVALPGGFGTLDELAEAVTWGQLGLHGKPIGLLDVQGYYRDLLAFVDRAVADGFIRPAGRSRLIVSDDPEHLLDELGARPPVAIR